MPPDWRSLLARFERFVADAAAPALARDGIEAWADHGPKVPVVWATAALPCGAAELTRFLVDDIEHTHREWYPMAESIEILESLGDGERVVRIVNRMPWPMQAREDVYYNARKELDGGIFVELSTSIEHDRAPPRPDLVRSAIRLAAKRMAPSASGCQYTALWNYDVAGTIGRLLPARLLAGPMLRDLVAETTRLRDRFGAQR